jgi:hypothetical protein
VGARDCQIVDDAAPVKVGHVLSRAATRFQ